MFERALTESVADVGLPSGGPQAMAANALNTAEENYRESEALWAQARLARQRSRKLKDRPAGIPRG